MVATEEGRTAGKEAKTDVQRDVTAGFRTCVSVGAAASGNSRGCMSPRSA
jgi:hypothetical protein